MYRLLQLLFGCNPVNESVATQVHFDARPETVWNRMKFFEEVPARPPWILRLVLPSPVRTDGDKSTVGSIVRCSYNRGNLFKLITVVHEPHLLEFQVVLQQLGIESCIVTQSGSYQISDHGDGACVTLTTNYQAQLGPRRLWRPAEKFLVRHLHRHILDGMGAMMSHGVADSHPAAGRLTPENAHSGGLACTASQFHCRR